jgi:ribosomal protein S18 acetylase RimI-like enzyme
VDAIDDIQLRAAVPGDSGAIVALARASFEPGLLQLTIHACDGVERYVRALIEAEGRGIDTTYAVAVDGRGMVGFAEMRRFSDRLFLNYIAVASHARSRGVGSKLLDAAIGRARRAGHERLELDVAEDNRLALPWYRGLGLREGSTTDWWTLPLPEAGGDEVAPVSGWAQATASHRAFGFSEVGVETPRRTYRVGVLGGSWFRVKDRAALDDPSLCATLRALDPSRRLLALVRRGDMQPHAAARAERRLTMLRLSGGLDDIARRLQERLGGLTRGPRAGA